MNQIYFKTALKVERLHYLFLKLIEAELEHIKVYNLNSTQALVLYHIGDDRVSIGELTDRGYYMGSNVSYNLKKMIKHDYIRQYRSPHDGRSSEVLLSEKGKVVFEKLKKIFEDQAEKCFEKFQLDQWNQLWDGINQLELFWKERSEIFKKW
jgi:DNA-binding MarR family transcriptional regulator